MGSAVIFNGTAVKALKDEIKFFTAGSIQRGTDDPTSVAKSGDPSSLYFRTSTGQLYKKNDSGSSTNWSEITSSAASTQSYEISNLGLSTSVAANALTISLKDSAGNDPSGGSQVKIGFRNSTITNGQYAQRSISAALSLVISSGSTLGHGSGVSRYIYVYALDNAGTVVLGASSAQFEDGTLVDTTAEGGAGAADSNSAMYSASSLSGVPCRFIGLLISNQATAGTWATNMTSVRVNPINFPVISARVKGTDGNAITNPDATEFINTDYDDHGIIDNSGTGTKVRVNTPGRYLFSLSYQSNAVSYSLNLHKNGNASVLTQIAYMSSTIALTNGSTTIDLLAGDYIEVISDSNHTPSSSDNTVHLSVERVK